MLLDVFQHHSRLVRAMREFGSSYERQKASEKKLPEEFQPMLFEISDQP